jgi:hypothetical protein
MFSNAKKKIWRKNTDSDMLTSLRHPTQNLHKIKKASVRKYSGSHRKLRPAGAEYKLIDDLLRNVAAHSGFPY